MTKNFFLKLTAILSFLFIATGAALAQGRYMDELDDPLQAIKTHLEKEGVSVVDYSGESQWGGLPTEIVDVLKTEYNLTDNDNIKNITLRDKKLEDFQIELGAEFAKKFTDADRATSAVNSVYYAIRVANWGNLPETIITNLRENGISNIEDLTNKAVDQKLSPHDYVIQNFNQILTEDQINLLIGELQYKGESQIRAMINAVAKVIRNLIGGIAIIFIIIAGIRMVMAGGEENVITEQKKSITYAVIGLVAILLLERVISIVYGVPGVERGVFGGAADITPEVVGIISFIKAVIGAVAIFMIIISGLKTVFSEGEEEKITNQRKSIIWILVGLVTLVINEIFVENLYIKPVEGTGVIQQSNVNNIINLIGKILQFGLGFVGLIAFAALVYGAGTLIANFGNEEVKEKSKKIIKNAIIGIIVIVSAFAIVSTVIVNAPS